MSVTIERAEAEAAGELGEDADVGKLIRAGLGKLAPADTRTGTRR